MSRGFENGAVFDFLDKQAPIFKIPQHHLAAICTRGLVTCTWRLQRLSLWRCWVWVAAGCKRRTGLPSVSTAKRTSVPRGQPSWESVDSVPSMHVSVTVRAPSAGEGRSGRVPEPSPWFPTTPSGGFITALASPHCALLSLPCNAAARRAAPLLCNPRCTTPAVALPAASLLRTPCCSEWLRGCSITSMAAMAAGAVQQWQRLCTSVVCTCDFVRWGWNWRADCRESERLWEMLCA